MEILSKILVLLIYVSIGLIFSFLAYKFTELKYKKSFKLSEEIDNHNKACGIMVSGMFIAIAIIMSAVL